ncbi:unnamed protein product [Symbiodinium sp. CCMP2592]|nr:unnamed protein product [Symbiodinium sp. CCMP2592]
MALGFLARFGAVFLFGCALASDVNDLDASLDLDGECDGSGTCALSAVQMRGAQQSELDLEKSEELSAGLEMGVASKVRQSSGGCPDGLLPGGADSEYCFSDMCPGPKAVFYSMAECSRFSNCVIGGPAAPSASWDCPPRMPYLADGRCFRNKCTWRSLEVYTMATNCNFYLSCIDRSRGAPPLKVPMEYPECSAHPACVDLRLSGNCCPTLEGTMLGCCS